MSATRPRLTEAVEILGHQSEFPEETSHGEALNATKVHVLTASPSEIDAFMYGGLAGTNVYTNLSQWL